MGTQAASGTGYRHHPANLVLVLYLAIHLLADFALPLGAFHDAADDSLPAAIGPSVRVKHLSADPQPLRFPELSFADPPAQAVAIRSRPPAELPAVTASVHRSDSSGERSPEGPSGDH